MIDLFISTGEMSGDLHGSRLIQELLSQRPSLKIGAVAGPKMRKLPIQEFFQMENLKVMGFIDVFFALPKIVKQFFAIRNQILELNPKATVLIDYPGFHLRLEKSLRKKGYRGKLIHFICPTVWAWGKKRIPQMAKHLDLLLAIFPFEKSCFANTNLKVEYIGHPLTLPIRQFQPKGTFSGKILALFPGSRKVEIERNLPFQLKVARTLKQLDPSVEIVISKTQYEIDAPDCRIVGPDDHYELMRASYLAIATSGTVTLELALHKTPTVVTFAIKPLDCFIAQKIFRINLPFYAMPNIVLLNQHSHPISSRGVQDEALASQVFPELFGPNLTDENLFFWAQKLFFDQTMRKNCTNQCEKIEKLLGEKRASKEAARAIFSSIDF